MDSTPFKLWHFFTDLEKMCGPFVSLKKLNLIKTNIKALIWYCWVSVQLTRVKFWLKKYWQFEKAPIVIGDIPWNLLIYSQKISKHLCQNFSMMTQVRDFSKMDFCLFVYLSGNPHVNDWVWQSLSFSSFSFRVGPSQKTQIQGSKFCKFLKIYGYN